jgi:hypothetical protein
VRSKGCIASADLSFCPCVYTALSSSRPRFAASVTVATVPSHRSCNTWPAFSTTPWPHSNGALRLVHGSPCTPLLTHDVHCRSCSEYDNPREPPVRGNDLEDAFVSESLCQRCNVAVCAAPDAVQCGMGAWSVPIAKSSIRLNDAIALPATVKLGHLSTMRQGTGRDGLLPLSQAEDPAWHR